MATIIDGKRISAEIRAELAEKTQEFKEKYHTVPGLAVIIVGEDPASRVYVRNKHKVNIIAIRDDSTGEINVSHGAEYVLRESDSLLVLGEDEYIDAVYAL